MLARERGDLIEIEAVRVACYSIRDELIEDAADVQLHAVREMPAMSEIQAKDNIARFEGCEIDSRICLRAAVRLNVSEFSSEELLCAVDRQLLDDVDELAAAIVASTRVALSVFVGEYTAGRLHDRGAGVV